MTSIWRAIGACALAARAVLVAGPPMGVAGPGGKDKPPGERVRELQGERVKALEEQLKGQDERVAVGREPLVTWLDALRDLEEAELDLAEKPAAEVEVLERSVRRFREAEDKVTEM